MGRIILFLFCAIFTFGASAATGKLSRYVDPQSYAYMYPYLSNQMRTELNPGTTVNQTNNPIDVIVKTKQMSAPRRVVSRPTTARAATTVPTVSGAASTPRRVVQRSAIGASAARAAKSGNSARRVVPRTRGAATTQTTINTNIISGDGVSTSRCLADYTECMNRYCERENTAYNRCYCSAKLSQIDATYQNTINDLMMQIIKIQGAVQWTDAEMNEYWMERIGNYVGENSWEKLDNALNIEWPTGDDRIRGQNAFMTGHEYCVQHLRACAYMASNMRDAYRSKISRDCETYEQSLLKIKNAAESIIEHYNE